MNDIRNKLFCCLSSCLLPIRIHDDDVFLLHRWRCLTGPTSTRPGTPSSTSPSASTGRTCWRGCSPTSRPTRCPRPTAAGASSTCLPTWRPTWPPPSGDTCRRLSGSGRDPSPASIWPNGPPIHCHQVSERYYLKSCRVP